MARRHILLAVFLFKYIFLLLLRYPTLTALLGGTFVSLQIMIIVDKTTVLARNSGARDAIRWCVVKGEARKSRQITCKLFAERIFAMMGWESDYRYRFQGMRIRYFDDEMYLFDLSADERFAPMKKDENGKRIVSAPVLPENWIESYGMSVEEHDMSTQVNFLDGFYTESEVEEKDKSDKPEPTVISEDTE